MGMVMPASDIPIADQIVCVQREIGMREKLYPRWVKDRKLTFESADLELARMRAVLLSLQAVQAAGDAPQVAAEAIRLEEQERVLGIVGRHMHSSPFVRVSAAVRGKRL